MKERSRSPVLKLGEAWHHVQTALERMGHSGLIIRLQVISPANDMEAAVAVAWSNYCLSR